ncbi:14745_t:CDS:2 [Cetraspora pellucida]|uniref:14745_t:CDS:1 n=1 Tax=Cetraspora pellucida TaxID=1433469 RepID=A0A9N8VHF5_9GLOM|nr:14745_t:CDS:2 [Cetraspora pellucida]
MNDPLDIQENLLLPSLPHAIGASSVLEMHYEFFEGRWFLVFGFSVKTNKNIPDTMIKKNKVDGTTNKTTAEEEKYLIVKRKSGIVHLRHQPSTHSGDAWPTVVDFFIADTAL